MSDFQNFEVNNLSLSKIISSSNPWFAMTTLRKVYASSIASLASLYGMKCLYFISLSVMTKIESYMTFVIGSLESGSLTIKSKAINFHAPCGVGGDLRSPYGACLFDFDLLQMLHSKTTFSTC